ncbi:MAG: hypothetical protein EAX96_18905 [Candidatus Lokiarchaeota archaeon]|nr:hypothetical protein [Candidatus Lokiarchaeota archaeon]
MKLVQHEFEIAKQGFINRNFDVEAIRGIAKREIIKYFRNKQQIFSSALMPTIFMIFLRPGFANMTGSGELGVFMGAGIICMVLIMSGIMMAGMPLIMDKMMGFQDIYAVAPVKRRNIVIGFIFGGALKSTFQSTIIIIIGALSGLIAFELGIYPNNFGLLALGTWYGTLLGILVMIGSVVMLYMMIFLAASIYSCIGLVISAKTDMTNSFLWFTLINMPLVFISGAIIPVENILFIGLFNPTTYFADAIRVWLGGQIGAFGTGNIWARWVIQFMNGSPELLNSPIALLVGFGLDLIVIAIFGVLLFYVSFKVFGSGLTESSGGFTAIFHKKTAEAREKMFENLAPKEREVMKRITAKVDMMTIFQTMENNPTGLNDLFERNGLTKEDAEQFMTVGMKLMQSMQPKQSKKKK